MLEKTEAPINARSMMYKALVQTLLLYGIKIWVVTNVMIIMLETFHHRIARWIEVITEREGHRRKWEWISVDATLEVTSLWPIREYVRSQKAKIMDYVSGRLIYNICTVTDRMEGSSIYLR